MNKGLWIGSAAGVLVVMGLGLYFWLESPNGRQMEATPVHGAEGASVRPGTPPVAGTQPGLNARPTPPVLMTPASTPAAVPGGVAGTPAPWLTPGAAGSSGADGLPATGVSIGKPGAPSLNDVQQRLQALVANGRQPTPREVEAVLADLQRNQGSNVVNGVNLQTLRDNLVRTDRIQQIAQEMQVIAANPRKEDLPRLQALSVEMQRLSAAMAPNVMQPASR